MRPRLLTLVAAVAGTLWSVQPAQAAFPGGNGLIAFTDFAAGGQIFTVHADGSGRRQVTHLAGQAHRPSWAPDGRSMLFESATAAGPVRIFSVRPDGSGLHQVTHDRDSVGHFGASYSPDGLHITFSRCSHECETAIARADGTDMRQVAQPPGSSFGARWSPDGRAFALWGLERHGFLSAVYVRPPSGGAERRITPPALLAGGPDWAPDGRSIVFFSDACCGGTHSRIYTVRPDGSGLRRLTSTDSRHQDFLPVFSPDGRQIAFSSDRAYRKDPSCCVDIWVMRADGSGMRRVTGGRGIAVLPSWQPRP